MNNAPIKIVFLDKKTFSYPLPNLNFPHHLINYELTEAHEISERIREADIVITNKCRFSKEIIEKALCLKLICLTATGYNNIDIVAARSKGISVANVKGYSSKSVAQHAIMLMLNLKRRFSEYHRDAKNGVWAQSSSFSVQSYPIFELDQLNLGLVGNGQIAEQLAHYAHAFSMNILKIERKGAEKIREGYVSFEECLKQSDVLSIHCPLNQETTNMMTLKEFKQMKSSSIIINTARGGIINEQDLLTALTENIIAGAGLDVIAEEPPKQDNLLTNSTLDNLVITPHVAWMGQSSLKTLAEETIHNIEAFIQGNPRNIIN